MKRCRVLNFPVNLMSRGFLSCHFWQVMRTTEDDVKSPADVCIKVFLFRLKYLERDLSAVRC